MDETKKPFDCKSDGCGMSFTNEDHLTVHTKKHAMVLQLSLGQKVSSFVADQTPTPTRLIRNCDEVGLFDDLHLQHVVNPFDETFRRAVESKSTATTPNLQHNHIVDILSTDNSAISKLSSSSSSAIISSSTNNGNVQSIVSVAHHHHHTHHAAEEATLHTPHVLPFYDDSRYRSSNNCSVAVSNVSTTSETTSLEHSNKLANGCKRKRPFPRQLVKVENVPTLVLSSSSSSSSSPLKTVRERLKDSILRGNKFAKVDKTPVETTVQKPEVKLCIVENTSVRKTLRDAPSSSTSKSTSENDEKRKLFERNREAAKRYRNKLKRWHEEIHTKNIQLEEENRKLRNELSQMRSAHSECSVTIASQSNCQSSLKSLDTTTCASKEGLPSSSKCGKIASVPAATPHKKELKLIKIAPAPPTTTIQISAPVNLISAAPRIFYIVNNDNNGKTTDKSNVVRFTNICNKKKIN